MEIIQYMEETDYGDFINLLIKNRLVFSWDAKEPFAEMFILSLGVFGLQTMPLLLFQPNMKKFSISIISFLL